MNRIKAIVIVFIFFSFYSIASSEQFTCEASQNPISAGSQFQITFTLSDANGSNFKAPNFGGLNVQMGPSTMQSTQIINGRMSSSFSYSYVVVAPNPGKYTISPASINVNGKTIQSNSITITATKGAPPQQQNQQNNSVDQQANNYLKNKMLIKVFVSKRNVYQGEQLSVTYKLYFKPELQNFRAKSFKEPTLAGFWKQDIDLSNSPTKRENLNGVAYNTKEIKKKILIPQQKGELEIDPLEIDFLVALQVRDGWFANFQDFEYKIASPLEKITVNPLPPDAPVDFRGAVGDMKFSATIDKTNTKTNEPVTLKIQVSGNGNLKLIDNFPLNLPPDFDSYDPKITDNISVSSEGLSGSKTFEYLLIPRHEGEFKITPVNFVYFDPAKKKYISIKSDEFVIKVEKGSSTSPNIVSGVQKEDLQLIGKDIRYIKTSSMNLTKKGEQFVNSSLFYIFSLLAPGLFFLFLFFLQKQRKLNKNVSLLRNKRATSVARRRLKLAEKYLKNQHQDKFYEEISRALWGYFGDKLSIPVSDLTKSTVSEALAQKNFNEDEINNLLETVESCEFARFAPGNESFEMGRIYNSAINIITGLEARL